MRNRKSFSLVDEEVVEDGIIREVSSSMGVRILRPEVGPDATQEGVG